MKKKTNNPQMNSFLHPVFIFKCHQINILTICMLERFSRVLGAAQAAGSLLRAEPS